jgi:hypothetical protein
MVVYALPIINPMRSGRPIRAMAAKCQLLVDCTAASARSLVTTPPAFVPNGRIGGVGWYDGAFQT